MIEQAAPMQLQTDFDGRLTVAACSGTALGGAGERLSDLRQWYQGLPLQHVSTVLHLGGLAFQIPDGDPAPIEAARHYPREAKLETWGCHPLELWESLLPADCHWRDAPPVIPVVHGCSKSVVAAIVCHYHLGSGTPDLLRRLGDLSLPELPATLPKILLVGGHMGVGVEYDNGNMAVSVGVFSADVRSGAVLRLHLRNPRGRIDDQTTKVIFSCYT